jgi:hypothetical protein
MKFIDLFTVEHTSKYFGNIAFSSDYYIDEVNVKYNDNDISIVMWDDIIFDENYLKISFGVIDKYLDIIQMVKDAVKNRSQNSIEIRGFNDHNDIQNIQAMVNNIYPHLAFGIDAYDNFYLSIDYSVSWEHPSHIFTVEMDQKLNITGMKYVSKGEII